MSEDTLKEFLADERKFLHDLSNHIQVAHGMSTFVLRSIKENPTIDLKDIERLEKSLNAVNKMTVLLNERREQIQKS